MSQTNAVGQQSEAGLIREFLRFGFKILSKVLPQEARVHQTKVDGLRIVVWLNEHIGRRLVLSRSFERDEIDQLGEYVDKGDICIDVGANVGWHTLHLARCCGPEGRVVAFEPVALNALLVELNARLNAFSWVTVERFAVSSVHDQNMQVAVSGGDSGYSYYLPAGRSGFDTVSSVTLDSYCASTGIAKIDVLKIDVEGAEMDVLEGAKRILSSPESRPKLIMVEVVEEYLSRFGASRREVFAFLAGLGYEPHVLKSGALQKVPEVSNEHQNFFFVAAAL